MKRIDIWGALIFIALMLVGMAICITNQDDKFNINLVSNEIECLRNEIKNLEKQHSKNYENIGDEILSLCNEESYILKKEEEERDYRTRVMQYYNKKLPYFGTLENVNYIYDISMVTGLDPDLIISIICIESNCRKNAVSSTGAIGLMQIQPKVWCKYFSINPKDLYIEKTNILIGCRIINEVLLRRYDGNIVEVLNAYNVGNNKEENRNWNYIHKVIDLYYKIKTKTLLKEEDDEEEK